MLRKVSHQVRRFALRIRTVNLGEIDLRLGHKGIAFLVDPLRETLVGAVERLGPRRVARVAEYLLEFHQYAARSLDAAPTAFADIIWLIVGRPALAGLRQVRSLEFVLPAVGGIAAYPAGTKSNSHFRTH